MAVARFDHVNLLTADIHATRDFFVAVLGLEPGFRPPFRSPGYWLYQGDQALIHISDASDHEQTHVDDIGAVTTGADHPAVDHLAFRCEGYAETTRRLQQLGIAYHEANVPFFDDRQLFVDGPEGVTLELIFPAAEVAGGRSCA
jgi:catechol 2,3-dioxygenase-like lactoylglutathione lyase family enzyme